METGILRQFIMLSINPEKGRIMIQNSYFRYALPGAVLMDFLKRGEITLENKKVKTSFRRNGEIIHDLFAEIMEKPASPKRVSYWIGKFSMKSRKIFRETINSLASSGIIRVEKRYFLNIIPYNRYFFNDRKARSELIESLRNILLQNASPDTEQVMLIGLLRASRSTKLLAVRSEEKHILRKAAEKLSKENELAKEVDKAIRDMQAAIISSIAVSAAVSHGHH